MTSHIENTAPAPRSVNGLAIPRNRCRPQRTAGKDCTRPFSDADGRTRFGYPPRVLIHECPMKNEPTSP